MDPQSDDRQPGVMWRILGLWTIVFWGLGAVICVLAGGGAAITAVCLLGVAIGAGLYAVGRRKATEAGSPPDTFP